MNDHECISRLLSGVPVWKMDQIDAVRAALSRLTFREREIIRLRFGMSGETFTLEEVAKRFKVTRERIRQIEKKALRKLKEMVNGEETKAETPRPQMGEGG